MNIALDYDATYTVDPEFWRQVIDLGRQHGHTFYCITGRSPRNPIDPLHEPAIPIKVIYADGDYKADAARRAKLRIDVWIDDMPQMIAGDGKLHFD